MDIELEKNNTPVDKGHYTATLILRGTDEINALLKMGWVLESVKDLSGDSVRFQYQLSKRVVENIC